MPILVCLCGMPQFPALAGRQPLTEEQGVLDAIAKAHQLYPPAVLAAAGNGWRKQSVSLSEYLLLERRLDRLQPEIYALGRRLSSRSSFNRQRWRGPSRREPKSRGRDPITVRLQSLGMDFRQAREVVNAFVEIWKAALRRGEQVELPIGNLVARKGRITLAEPRPVSLNGALPLMLNKMKDRICERCGSRWFADQDFGEYAAATYSQGIGGDLHALGNPQKARICMCGYPIPYPGRIHPKNDAAQNFRSALENARTFVSIESSIQEGFAELAGAAASQSDLHRVENRLAQLEQDLEALRCLLPQPRAHQKKQRSLDIPDQPDLSALQRDPL